MTGGVSGVLSFISRFPLTVLAGEILSLCSHVRPLVGAFPSTYLLLGWSVAGPYALNESTGSASFSGLSAILPLESN